MTRPRGALDLGETAETLETLMRDGVALGLRIPPLPRVAGRGYLVVDGAAEEVQVALPRVEVAATG